ncbi:phosphatase PAP2 family protein [Roseateles sp.]|uniref:phosphatase PAP2 family protein n=1 Tax=Roseateles sp. TaxID=1971397 RepID=UPI002DF882B1|nr:phosphatase PAP2 family protein [Roseateles sp.]
MTSRMFRRPFLLTGLAALCLTACGGGNDSYTIPSAPQGLGTTDSAPVADEAATPPFVDNVATNQRGDARYATRATNAGVRVVAGFLDIWTPTLPAGSTEALVDAGQTAPANGSFPAVAASAWTGIPGSATDGTVKNAVVHKANIQYVIDATKARTAAQEIAAYEDDRRGKGYSVTDGLGPLTAAWRTAAQQTTTISGIPADATTVKYDDKGNNVGVGGAANPGFGLVVDLLNSTIGANGSTEPAKRYFKYARPYRWTDSVNSPSVAGTWSGSVSVLPALVPVKSNSPATDGGFLSGHAAEATRDVLAMAYVMPERFQELVARGLELGENRILAGMHSPLDVIGGRIQAQAVAAANLAALTPEQRKAAYDQAHKALMAAAGTTDLVAFNAYAHAATPANDRFADHATNKANYLKRLTYGFSQIADAAKPAVVPKGAEVLLETRLPYLDAGQRRVVLKTTALPSGYPAMDDAEGWGRLNLFGAADGYGAFNGDVVVTMDASLGGFNAADAWRNDIGGAGKLTKKGSGALALTGNNSYTGGTEIVAGTLQANSANALGKGDVYLGGGSLACKSPTALTISGGYTQRDGSTLALTLGSGTAGQLNVSGTVTLDGGSLVISFPSGYKPAAGDMLTVISAAGLHGSFKSITVDGYRVTPVYGAKGLQLRIDA